MISQSCNGGQGALLPHAPSCAMSHLRTVRAFSMVSAVVKVLDTTTCRGGQHAADKK